MALRVAAGGGGRARRVRVPLKPVQTGAAVTARAARAGCDGEPDGIVRSAGAIHWPRDIDTAPSRRDGPRASW
jgi:hypothetical protein